MDGTMKANNGHIISIYAIHCIYLCIHISICISENQLKMQNMISTYGIHCICRVAFDRFDALATTTTPTESFRLINAHTAAVYYWGGNFLLNPPPSFPVVWDRRPNLNQFFLELPRFS